MRLATPFPINHPTPVAQVLRGFPNLFVFPESMGRREKRKFPFGTYEKSAANLLMVAPA